MSDADLILYWKNKSEEQAVEIREGDYWQERARQSFANGTCPCCFCADEGPHENGCLWNEMQSRFSLAEKVVETRRHQEGGGMKTTAP